MVDAVCVEEGGPAFDAMDYVTFFDQKFSQESTVLPSDNIINATFSDIIALPICNG